MFSIPVEIIGRIPSKQIQLNAVLVNQYYLSNLLPMVAKYRSIVRFI